MRRRILLLLLVLLLFGLGGVAFVHYFEWQEREITLPPRGEARYNPLYALGKALQLHGHDVRARATLQLDAMALAPGDLLLLATDIRSIGDDDAIALIDWMHEGGRLVFALPAAAGGRDPALIEQLQLSTTAEAGCVRWRADGADAPAWLCARSGLLRHEDSGWRWWWEDGDGVALMARADEGDGQWLALPDFDLFAGRALDDPNHAALTWQLLAPLLGEGRVHLVYAVDLPPLYVLLLQRGWPVWVPALLALLAWLWRRSQRLGPVLPLAAPDRRALLEHVRAAGELAFRSGRGAALHAALRRRFDARLAREAPALALLHGDAQVRAIAAAWRIDEAQVRHALQPHDLTRPEAYLASIRSLTQLQAPR